MALPNTACRTCNGLGAIVRGSSPAAEYPDLGWSKAHIVERCDSCEMYASDADAALAVTYHEGLQAARRLDPRSHHAVCLVGI